MQEPNDRIGKPGRRDVLQLLGMAGLPWGGGKAADARTKPLRRIISPNKPLFMLEGGSKMWNLLPEEFRTHCAVMMHAGSGVSQAGARLPLFDELAKLQAAGIPVVITVQVDEADSPPTRLDTIAKAFDEFPNLIGCRACELSCGPGFNPPERRNLIELIRLCGEHRALLNWQDMGYPYQREHIFMQAGRDRELFDALASNGDSVILTEKNNGWGKYYQTRSLVLGMWASGIVANWGFNAEDWWWFEQGYGELFQPSKGRRGWARQHGSGFQVTKGWDFASTLSYPDVLYAQNVLCAMAGGATVYSFESHHAYANEDQNGVYRLTPAWKNAIYPLLKSILDYNLIPERDHVVARMKVAYQDSGEVGTELDNTGEQLYRPLYGAQVPDEQILAGKLSPELLMHTGRYYYLPVLPKLVTEKARSRFPNIIRPHQFADAESQRAYFDKVFPVESTGDALVLHINGTWFVTNSHENKNIAQDFGFRFAVNGKPVELSGRLEPHSMLFATERNRKLHLHVNNYRVKTHIWDEPRPEVFDIPAYLHKYVTSPDDKERRTTRLRLTVLGKGAPALAHSTRHGSVESKWDAKSRRLEIGLNHNGPVDLRVTVGA